MIKLEHVVLPSPEQMDFVIEGMRNAKNSWEKSDSEIAYGDPFCAPEGFELGPNDNKLMNQLSDCGPVHSKYMRMIIVYVRITAPLYWWKEFDTYKVGTVSNSCSTMHKITAKEFTLEDFSTEHIFIEKDDFMNATQTPFSALDMIDDTITIINFYREKYLECDKALKTPEIPLDKRKELVELRKQYWWQIIQLLPSSYNQTRNIMLNYEVLKNIYIWRKDHKLDEWVEFCKWIETLPYSEIITNAK